MGSCGATMSGCERLGLWRSSLRVLQRMCAGMLLPALGVLGCAIGACAWWEGNVVQTSVGTGQLQALRRWRVAQELLLHARRMRVQDDGSLLSTAIWVRESASPA